MAQRRPIWTGAISFGLVNVPVRMITAVRPKDVHFHLLHEKDGARIREKRVCTKDGQEVPYEETAKGYEISKGRTVMIGREELHAADPKADRAIDIEDFVDLGQIDPIYFQSTYYLLPDRGAGRAYALLVQAMERSKKVGLARVVMRTKQYLCAVRPLGKGALGLSTMYYGDEVSAPPESDEPEANLRPKELQMAEGLIDALATKFDPKKYRDEHREKILDLIQRKAEGEEIVAPEAPEAPRKVVNLMKALEQSLAARRREDTHGERRFRQQAARAKKPARTHRRSRSRQRAR